MGRGKHCSVDKRKLILQMKADGISITNIAKNLYVSRKLVYNALKRNNDEEQNLRRLRSRKTSVLQDRLIVRIAKKNPFTSSSAIKDDINKKYGISVSSRTIRRRLNESKLFGRTAVKKPLVSKKNLKARLEFAKDNIDRPLSFWKNVLWSDESKFNRFGSDGKRQVWRPVNQEFNPRYTIKTIKHGGGNVMVWAAFSWHGVGPIVKIDSKMDKFLYKSILKDHMLPFADDNLPLIWTFMHDNDPKHTSGLVKDWIIDEKIRMLKWPAQSPDINPIENLWNDVENHVKSAKPKNLNDLWIEIQNGWKSITPDRCQKLVESLPRRLAAVLANKGFPTKY